MNFTIPKDQSIALTEFIDNSKQSRYNSVALSLPKKLDENITFDSKSITFHLLSGKINDEKTPLFFNTNVLCRDIIKAGCTFSTNIDLDKNLSGLITLQDTISYDYLTGVISFDNLEAFKNLESAGVKLSYINDDIEPINLLNDTISFDIVLPPCKIEHDISGLIFNQENNYTNIIPFSSYCLFDENWNFNNYIESAYIGVKTCPAISSSVEYNNNDKLMIKPSKTQLNNLIKRNKKYIEIPISAYVGGDQLLSTTALSCYPIYTYFHNKDYFSIIDTIDYDNYYTMIFDNLSCLNIDPSKINLNIDDINMFSMDVDGQLLPPSANPNVYCVNFKLSDVENRILDRNTLSCLYYYAPAFNHMSEIIYTTSNYRYNISDMLENSLSSILGLTNPNTIFDVTLSTDIKEYEYVFDGNTVDTIPLSTKITFIPTAAFQEFSYDNSVDYGNKFEFIPLVSSLLHEDIPALVKNNTSTSYKFILESNIQENSENKLYFANNNDKIYTLVVPTSTPNLFSSYVETYNVDVIFEDPYKEGRKTIPNECSTKIIGQTIETDDNDILYRGSIPSTGISVEVLFKNAEDPIFENDETNTILPLFKDSSIPASYNDQILTSLLSSVFKSNGTELVGKIEDSKTMEFILSNDNYYHTYYQLDPNIPNIYVKFPYSIIFSKSANYEYAYADYNNIIENTNDYFISGLNFANVSSDVSSISFTDELSTTYTKNVFYTEELDYPNVVYIDSINNNSIFVENIPSTGVFNGRDLLNNYVIINGEQYLYNNDKNINFTSGLYNIAGEFNMIPYNSYYHYILNNLTANINFVINNIPTSMFLSGVVENDCYYKMDFAVTSAATTSSIALSDDIITSHFYGTLKDMWEDENPLTLGSYVNTSCYIEDGNLIIDKGVDDVIDDSGSPADDNADALIDVVVNTLHMFSDYNLGINCIPVYFKTTTNTGKVILINIKNNRTESDLTIDEQ